ncbi:hypothetical protein [Clostridium sporogenes]|uniref:hypothetical protein n=1 Tax=Clostridium sporogenes TaxID=1509 RepID=UPI00024BA8C8|nr:hypothetical protein [Clostridium sporogenes]EHN14508.1 hypothetical protein IYC_13569 [Clostridium sporogenes PA 3679]MDU4597873.1 hypothetical protein [Clostridium sporogenes]NFQ35612.1 hypothetical protein [Clostridium sporogenes]NFQ61623.1 hypothetical protein [Clostridium sporogenes]NFQ86815.1 hypothetical protein [Clostridium sporogenes]
MIDIREHNIGGTGLKKTDRLALINIINKAEANESTIKANIANALNTKTGSNLTNNSTWMNIQNAIGNMKIRQWDSGVVDSNSGIVTINLNFIPSILLATSNTGARYASALINNKWMKLDNYASSLFRRYTSSPATKQLELDTDTLIAGYTFHWIAIE